jgi:hypothetical protein
MPFISKGWVDMGKTDNKGTPGYNFLPNGSKLLLGKQYGMPRLMALITFFSAKMFTLPKGRKSSKPDTWS